MTSVGDHELIKLIDDSVGGDFRALTAASERLASYPKQDLIERILRIRQGFSELDRRQISLAFVLCELDWEYESNKHLIVSDFAKEPHQQNLNADWEAWLINRLIRRGDKGLLPVLFNATKWSDGALSTDLSGMMVEHVKDEASTFVAALATVDEKTRQRVYSFINVRDLNYNDLAKIKKTLSSYSSDSANNVVARELLRFLRKAS